VARPSEPCCSGRANSMRGASGKPEHGGGRASSLTCCVRSTEAHEGRTQSVADSRSHEGRHVLQGRSGVAELLAKINVVEGFPACVASRCGRRRAHRNGIRICVRSIGLAVLVASWPVAARPSVPAVFVGSAIEQRRERGTNIVRFALRPQAHLRRRPRAERTELAR